MRFVMVGSGAVGGYFGARLQQTGQEVIFVARGEQQRVMKEHGLILCSNAEETRLYPVVVTNDLASIGPADYVLIGVKTWQLDDVIPKLPLLKGNKSLFLTLQNGVEAPQRVAEAVGRAHTLAGLVRGFFQMESPGIIQHVGVQPAIIFGALDRIRTPEIDALQQCLLNAGVHAEVPDNIEIPLWEKFLMVTSLSGGGAVTRSTIGEIRAHPVAWQMLQRVMAEIVEVACVRGVQLPADVLDRTLRFIHTFPPEATTSMQRDIMQGMPSELEAQTGAVVRLGNELGIPVTVSQFIYDSLILQERRARQKLGG